MNRLGYATVMIGLWSTGWLWAQEVGVEEAAIRKAVGTYVAAFNQGDAKKLADHWSPDAVYTNRVSGEHVVGRAAIAEQFAALFKAQPGTKLEVTTESIKLLAPSVAVEHGSAKLLVPASQPEDVSYTAIYVKRDGLWLLDRVTDEAVDPHAARDQHLQQLQWMVGRWVDQDEHATIETVCDWTENHSFLSRSFKVVVGDLVQLSGMQIIGWDPIAQQIRSWTFDSDGGFASATWTHDKDRWFIHNVGVMVDGRKGTMVNVLKPVDENSFTWQTIERTVDGELLPNIDEVVIVRQ